MQKISKKALTLLLAVGLTTNVVAAVGCSNNADDKISIVTTIFPEYDWVKQILGDRFDDVEVTLLLDNGVDLHSYQPTAQDIVTISTCDMFVYVGGHSDEWVDDVLAQAINKDMVVVDLMEVLGDLVKEEEIVDGMEGEHEDDHEDHEDGEHGDHEEHEYDEHIWLSLTNAQVACREIADRLSDIDSENEAEYTANANAYIAELSALDGQYEEAVAAATCNTLLFGDRFPFRYLVDDYGIEYYAAFSGCSAESEASFETIAFLAGKVDELGLSSVITIEGSTTDIAKTIVNATKAKNAKILSLDSMQSVTMKDVNDGANYLSIMEKNLNVLKEALK